MSDNPTSPRAGDVRLLSRAAAQERVLELLAAEDQHCATIERLRNAMRAALSALDAGHVAVALGYLQELLPDEDHHQ